MTLIFTSVVALVHSADRQIFGVRRKTDPTNKFTCSAKSKLPGLTCEICVLNGETGEVATVKHQLFNGSVSSAH